MKSWLQNVRDYRFFILSSIRNDLINQFVRSRLGGLWMIVHPLVMVAIYAFVLSAILSAKFEGIDNRFAYAIYLTSGILGWTLFSDVVSRNLNLFVGNAELLKKMRVPKIALPMIMAGTSFVSHCLLFAAILVIFAFLGHPPTASLLWLPVISGLLLIFSMSIGLIVGVLNVFIRDIAQVVPILLQFLFWFTPIVYPVVIIPEHMRWALQLNPIYPVIDAFHSVLAYQRAPDLSSLAIMAAASVFLAAVGLWLVRRAANEMVDVL